MKTSVLGWLAHSSRRTAAAIVAIVLATALPSRAEEDGARKILKAMSDYLASQTNLSFKFDSDVEVITPEIQKIQFSASRFLSSGPQRHSASPHPPWSLRGQMARPRPPAWSGV
jgi:hypothetical protein